MRLLCFQEALFRIHSAPLLPEQTSYSCIHTFICAEGQQVRWLRDNVSGFYLVYLRIEPVRTYAKLRNTVLFTIPMKEALELSPTKLFLLYSPLGLNTCLNILYCRIGKWTLRCKLIYAVLSDFDTELRLRMARNMPTNSVTVVAVVLWEERRHLTYSAQPTLNSVALVRERTIPTELPPLFGEVSANFCG
jgi:hypothetical protein